VGTVREPADAIDTILGTRGRRSLADCDEALTDSAHAERFAQVYGESVRFDHRRGLYLVYRSPFWRPDEDGQIYRLAIEFARARQAESLDLPDRSARERAVQWCIRAESKPQLDRLVGLAKMLPPIADTDAWDTEPYLLGAPNGVIDLRTGKLRAGSPDDRITRSMRVAYDVHAAAPRWRRFIAEIFNNDVELMAFIQRFVGYCLTGCTHEQVLVLAQGGGENGKGVLMHTLLWLFGDYGANLPFSALELKQRASIPTDIASLNGRRLVTASETSDGVKLNEPRIKALTGCDPITARFLYREEFTFQPVAKFWLAVNHRPSVSDMSHGFWRRLKLVPFTRTFSGHERDPHLETYFKTIEAAGILRWAVEGCLEWLASGLGSPAAIEHATADYKVDSDPLADFLAECTEADAAAITRAAAAQEIYGKWADRQRLSKHDRLSAKELGKRMAERFERRHRSDGWVYSGFRVVTDKLW
jgi:putative DNA primase/helicase